MPTARADEVAAKVTSMVAPVVTAMGVALPLPGSVSKKYSAATMLGLLARM